MARRLITSLLTIAYFLGQLAAPIHSHGDSRENQPSDHDARPHFHLSWMAHGGHSRDEDHDHTHDGGDHFHHYHDGDARHSHANSPVAAAEHDDHDSDAIYLPNGAGLSLPAKSVTAPVCLSVFSNFAIATMATLPERFDASREAEFRTNVVPTVLSI